MNKKKAALGAGIAFGALFAGSTYSFGKRMYDATFGDKPKIGREGLDEYYSSKGDLTRLAEFPHQKFMVENSKNGYLIETLHVKSNRDNPNVMIIVHGITSNYFELLNVAFKYLEDGTNVIMYNQRQTGQTGGDNFTFGLFEKFDMEEIATIARRLYPDGWVGVHGFSMGAATAAMHSELNEQAKRVDFYILDGPFHTIESTLDAAFDKKKYPVIWRPYLKWSGNLMALAKARIKYRDVQPIHALKKASVPVLILHGTADATCPYKGAQLMYDAIAHAKKELKAFPDLGHCQAHYLETKNYFKTIRKFIEKNV